MWGVKRMCLVFGPVHIDLRARARMMFCALRGHR
jgi:hypothetical protein